MSSLDEQTLSRKERLAKLRNLKRKRSEEPGESKASTSHIEVTETEIKSGELEDNEISNILRSRNYDPETRGPKQGFFESPLEKLDVPTVEQEAARIIEEAVEEDKEGSASDAKDESEEEAEIDIASLQPRSASWDLKRDIQGKLDLLEKMTDVAINRIVREQLKKTKKDAVVVPVGVDLNKEIERNEQRG
ncbi:mRNA splicing factor [Dipodascopsis uninucleata]